jgi:hypothetical protein
MPVILSVPKPSLAAKFVGQILSIIIPITPGSPLIAFYFLSGDLLAGVLLIFDTGDFPVVYPLVTLFLPIAVDEPFVVGETPAAALNVSVLVIFFIF